MSRYGSARSSAWQKTGAPARLIIGSLIVLLFGYVGVIWLSPYPISSYWPIAALWAAVGWGGGKPSILPVFMLILLGLLTDLLTGAPVGCWPSILLVAYILASVFRKRAATDQTGLIRFLGDCMSFVVAFLFAHWLIGAYLGSIETRDIIGGFVTALLLFFPLRSIFRLSSDNRVYE